MTNFLTNDSILNPYPPDSLIAGVDEVGRGCLFGPVVASAVVIPLKLFPKLAAIDVKDSKKLSVKKRLKLSQEIYNLATSVAIGYASVKEIDRLNILQASLLGMKRSVNKLTIIPDLCLVDGKYTIPDINIPQQTIIRGDQRSLIIAAASIIAKVWRDQLIIRLAHRYPHYDLVNNKGYGTKKHLQALEKWGVSPQHRLSFSPCRIKRN
jgi:ribonuclease HII